MWGNQISQKKGWIVLEHWEEVKRKLENMSIWPGNKINSRKSVGRMMMMMVMLMVVGAALVFHHWIRKKSRIRDLWPQKLRKVTSTS